MPISGASPFSLHGSRVSPATRELISCSRTCSGDNLRSRHRSQVASRANGAGWGCERSRAGAAPIRARHGQAGARPADARLASAERGTLSRLYWPARSRSPAGACAERIDGRRWRRIRACRGHHPAIVAGPRGRRRAEAKGEAGPAGQPSPPPAPRAPTRNPIRAARVPCRFSQTLRRDRWRRRPWPWPSRTPRPLAVPARPWAMAPRRRSRARPPVP